MAHLLSLLRLQSHEVRSRYSELRGLIKAILHFVLLLAAIPARAADEPVITSPLTANGTSEYRLRINYSQA